MLINGYLTENATMYNKILKRTMDQLRGQGPTQNVAYIFGLMHFLPVQERMRFHKKVLKLNPLVDPPLTYSDLQAELCVEESGDDGGDDGDSSDSSDSPSIASHLSESNLRGDVIDRLQKWARTKGSRDQLNKSVLAMTLSLLLAMVPNAKRRRVYRGEGKKEHVKILSLMGDDPYGKADTFVSTSINVNDACRFGCPLYAINIEKNVPIIDVADVFHTRLLRPPRNVLAEDEILIAPGVNIERKVVDSAGLYVVTQNKGAFERVLRRVESQLRDSVRERT